MKNDLISRKALLEKKKEMDLCWAVTEWDILDAPAVVPEQRWVPRTKPPEVWKDENGEAINFIVAIPGAGVDIANWIEPTRCWFCMGVPVKVTHWMPLPELPKENEK